MPQQSDRAKFAVSINGRGEHKGETMAMGFSFPGHKTATHSLPPAPQLVPALDPTACRMVGLMDARDPLLGAHARNVARYSVALAHMLHLPPAVVADIQTAGLLHDLGKLSVPAAILAKPDALTAAEYGVVQGHVATGVAMISTLAAVRRVAPVVADHHERFDGSGYPQCKRGREISLGGRILAIADTLDTMLTGRAYQPASPLPATLAEITRCAGSQFDPAIVGSLHRLVTRRPAFFPTAMAT